MKYLRKNLLCLCCFLCLLNNSTITAQTNNTTQQTDPAALLSLEIEPLKTKFKRNEPLVFDVIFSNGSRSSIFVNLVSSFQFQGDLEGDSKSDFGRGNVWMVNFAPHGDIYEQRREHYKEVPPGQSYKLRVTSTSIQRIGFTKLSWRRHKPRDYKFTLHYYSGNKRYFFPNQWEGSRISNEVVLHIK